MRKAVLALIIILAAEACAPPVHIRSWRTTQPYDRDLNKIVVLGLVNSVSLRGEVEDEIAIAGRKMDFTAINGMSMFPPELGKPFDDIERVKARLRDKGFDGILTVALIDVSAPRYVGPETAYLPLVYYDRFRNYYYRTYDLVYRPGYFTLNSRYFVETNLYELKQGSLIWSGRSRAFEGMELGEFLPFYARNLFRELVETVVIIW